MACVNLRAYLVPKRRTLVFSHRLSSETINTKVGTPSVIRAKALNAGWRKASMELTTAMVNTKLWNGDLLETTQHETNK